MSKPPNNVTSPQPPSFRQTLLFCPQSPGRIGKSTTAEAVKAYADFAGIPCAALDCDTQHRVLANRYPQDVGSFPATRSDDDFHRMVKSIPPEALLTILDFPSNQTDFLLQCFRRFGLLDAFAAKGIGVTLLIFAAEDYAAESSASVSVQYFRDRAKYLVVENRGHSSGEKFRRTALFRKLKEYGSGELVLPAASKVTMADWVGLERASKTYLQLAKAANDDRLDDTVRADLQHLQNQVMVQLEALAVPFLVPSAELIKNRVPPLAALEEIASTSRLDDPLLV
jgi:hypothetical protein